MTRYSVALVVLCALAAGSGVGQSVNAETPVTVTLYKQSDARGGRPDWDPGYWKGSCADNEKLLGISNNTDTNNAYLHRGLCVPKYWGGQTRLLATDGSRNVQEFQRQGDWAPGFLKLECGENQYAIGVSQAASATTAQNQKTYKVHGLLCATAGGKDLGDGVITTVRQFDTDSSVDSENPSGDWDLAFFKGQCNPDEKLVGISIGLNGRAHSILCSGGSEISVYYGDNDRTWGVRLSDNYGDSFSARKYPAIYGAAPAVVNYDGKMYFAYRGPEGFLCLRTSSDRGSTLSDPAACRFTTSEGQPGMAVYGGKLYIATYSASAQGGALTAVADGPAFETPEPLTRFKMSSTPALAVLNDTLYMAYVRDNHLCVASLRGAAAPAQVCTTWKAQAERPGMTAAYGSLYVSFREPGNRIRLIVSDDPARRPFIEVKTNLPETALSPTALLLVRKRLFAAFTGADTTFLVLSSTDGKYFSKNWSAPADPDSVSSLVDTEVSDTIPGIRFAVYGDMPYEEKDRQPFFDRLLPTLASSPNIPFVFHVGDIGRPGNGGLENPKNPFDSCSDVFRTSTLYDWNRLNRPLVFTAGDNDWTDCNIERGNANMDPVQEFSKVRGIFAGHASLRPCRCFNDDLSPALNNGSLWVDRGIAYLALNVVGSDNGYVPNDYEKAEKRNAEAVARIEDTLILLEKARKLMVDTPSIDALVIAFHVDIFRGATAWDMTCDRQDKAGQREPYKDICSKLFEVAKDVKDAKGVHKPVLLVHGDTNAHCFWRYPSSDFNLWVLNAPGDFRGIDADVVSFNPGYTQRPFDAFSLLHSAALAPEGQEACDYKTK